MSRLIVAAFATVLLAGCGPSEAQKVLCASNLRMLWTLQYAAAKKGPMPASTGRKFWLDTQSAEDLDAYVCPLSGKSGAKGVTTYRGPKTDVKTLKGEDVVGACVGYHSDGSVNILRKDGSVVGVEKNDPAAAEARSSTSD